MAYDVHSKKWQWTSESATLAAIVVVFAGLMLFGLSINVSGRLIAECAEGQDLAMRDTQGIAQMKVVFKDGKWDSISCVSVE